MKEYIEFKNGKGSYTGVFHKPDNLHPHQKIPAILYLHDLGGNALGPSRIFGEIAQKLEQELNYSSLRISFRGFGESSTALNDMVIENHLFDANQALLWLMEKEYIDDSRLAIIGHGYGGAIASTVAQHYPQVKKIVLLSPPINLPKFFIERCYYSLFRPDPGQRVFVNTEDVEEVFDSHGSIDVFGYQYSQHFFESLKNYKPLVDIQNLSEDTRALIIYGTEDKVVGDAPSLLLRTVISNVDTQVDRYRGLPIEGANHYFNSLSCKRQVMEAVTEFVQESF